MLANPPELATRGPGLPQPQRVPPLPGLRRIERHHVAFPVAGRPTRYAIGCHRPLLKIQI
ncbi:hypothetical protein [Hymenobacter terrestris]|uniref:Uncharacterized protein n=1 Tax=Hymenobacter terrestris TaxID=2748310 RepID=A0ABX2Q5X5_9BACT|nr:hypothetical protein [Hymenobacter terrestris]NVO86374.1 hypothetical protein [Hymenobacter terrestris]